MNSANRLLVAAAALVLTTNGAVAQERSPQIGNNVLKQMRRTYPCRPNTIDIRPSVDPTPNDACVLIMAVRHAIALGRASELGVSPGDSGSIVRAEPFSMRFRDVKKPHRVNAAYWAIELTFAGKLPRVEAIIDQQSGRIGIRPYGL